MGGRECILSHGIELLVLADWPCLQFINNDASQGSIHKLQSASDGQYQSGAVCVASIFEV